MKKKKADNQISEEKDIDAESKVAAEQENIEEASTESEDSVVFSDEQIIEMQKELLNLQIQLRTSEEKLLRSHAEFENFRKRGIREKNEIRKKYSA